jgi:antirestriction protein ArdC
MVARLTPPRQAMVRRLVQSIEQGTPAWRPPWLFGWPFDVETGAPYKGPVGCRLLDQARRLGLRSNVWGTRHQWHALGCSVRLRREPDGARLDGERLLALFNAEQVDGDAAERARVTPAPPGRLAGPEHLVHACGADVRSGYACAFYHLGHDLIGVPDVRCFASSSGYYTCLFHELCHWVGHTARLGRLDAAFRHGTPRHALEELVAELGSLFLAGAFGLTSLDLRNHAAYLAIWIDRLRWAPCDLARAAPAAAKAADLLFSFTGDRDRLTTRGSPFWHPRVRSLVEGGDVFIGVTCGRFAAVPGR